MVKVGSDTDIVFMRLLYDGGIDLRFHDLVLPELSVKIVYPHFDDIGAEGGQLLYLANSFLRCLRAIDMCHTHTFGRHSALYTKSINGREHRGAGNKAI